MEEKLTAILKMQEMAEKAIEEKNIDGKQIRDLVGIERYQDEKESK